MRSGEPLIHELSGHYFYTREGPFPVLTQYVVSSVTGSQISDLLQITTNLAKIGISQIYLRGFFHQL
jgi:hypothetical protein